jgi:hypothetical protein
VGETRIHPETGKPLRLGVRRETVRFCSLSQQVEVPGWHPDDDGDGVHSGADLAESDRVYRELRAICEAGARGSQAAEPQSSRSGADHRRRQGQERDIRRAKAMAAEIE